jgi:hypothetical protein
MAEESELPDPMADNNDGHFSNASLGVFHIDSALRRLCLEMSEPFETYEKLVQCRVRHLRERAERQYECLIPEKEHKVKKRLLGLNQIFDTVILVLIVFSSLMLPLDSPLNDPDSEFTKKLAKVGIVFTVCFLFELTVKVIAKGFYSNQLVI